MGNATQKLNRKFDALLKKAYSYIFREEEEVSEISDEASSDELNNNVQDLQQDNEPKDQQDANPDQEMDENVSTHSYQMESIIHTAITKEELLQDKRKASFLLQSEFDAKKVCLNMENKNE
ncbi:unnamed protein product (macronuclear) [Paramecium tetraurelia]|uniref:Uncharacterized protein n=1 Tax=Paramecium tetraurelia TaxID=5888 RepID=A0D0C6_PARTE|nr:uncharacterized protein GSPATT00012045001 [Paramecium tetraurelia]CAK76493.1 unnamed protein product [Paramecium tetraurelia]|eukprot:XP_001443890.1 hypothetical protein (macronuclear) [Paramecium tetraurelia strain d4-2]